jgi:hypothetical protein
LLLGLYFVLRSLLFTENERPNQNTYNFGYISV